MGIKDWCDEKINSEPVRYFDSLALGLSASFGCGVAYELGGLAAGIASGIAGTFLLGGTRVIRKGKENSFLRDGLLKRLWKYDHKRLYHAVDVGKDYLRTGFLAGLLTFSALAYINTFNLFKEKTLENRIVEVLKEDKYDKKANHLDMYINKELSAQEWLMSETKKQRIYLAKQINKVNSNPYDKWIRKYCDKYEVDKYIPKDFLKYDINCVKLIKGLIKTESDVKHDAVSEKGAIGPMQLMPRTAKDLKVNPYKPQENIAGGIMLVRDLLRSYKDVWVALNRYNCDRRVIDSAIKKSGSKNFWIYREYMRANDYTRSVKDFPVKVVAFASLPEVRP
jgi:hypothetical protein